MHGKPYPNADVVTAEAGSNPDRARLTHRFAKGFGFA